NCPGARAVLARLCRAPLLRCPRTPSAGVTALAVSLRRASRGLAAVRCWPPPRFARLGGGPLLASAALRAAWRRSAAGLRRASRGLAAVRCWPPPRFARLGGGPLLASAALRAAWRRCGPRAQRRVSVGHRYA